MARLGKVTSKFYGGEFSYWLRGQYDLTAYQYALDTLYNMNVQIYGPMSRRMGTNRVAELPEGTTSNCRLIPFTVDEDTIYVLVFTNKKMRVLTPEGRFVLKSDGSIYELEVPYTSDQLFQLHYAQSSDILFVAHPSWTPRQIAHYGTTDWRITNIDFIDGPYFAENTDESRTLTVSGKTGNITITSSVDLFSSQDNGRLVRIKHGNTWGYARITGYTNAKTVNATVKRAFEDVTASANWRLGSFSTASGFPSAITFHQERLWFGGTKSQPQTVWSSASSDFTNFAPTDEVGDVLDDSSIVLTMLSDETNTIQWMKSDTVLNVGTLGAEFKIFSYAAESVLTPSTAQAQRVTSLGSENVDPVSIPTGTVFVQRSGRKLRHAVFTNSVGEDDTPADLNIWASHIADAGIAHIAYQSIPNSTIWGITNDNLLVSLTYEPTQNVMGWARHKIAGGVRPTLHHLCTVPYKSSLQSRLFLVVDRDNIETGKRSRCIEFMTNEITNKTPQQDMVYTDYSVQFTNYFNLTALQYDSDTGEIRINVNTTGTEKKFNNTGIYWENKNLQNNSVVKLDSYTVLEPDMLFTTDYLSKTKLSELLENRAFKLVADTSVSGYTHQLKDRYGNDLGDEFKDCFNDVSYVNGKLRMCYTEVTGLTHLKDNPIQVLADGAVLENVQANNGAIELNNYYANINVGFGYTSYVKTLPVALRTASEEVSTMWTQKIIRAYINIYKSLGFKYGVEATNLSVEPFRSTRERTDQATPLVTGTKEITIGDITENKGQVMIVQDQPLPLNILSIGLKIDATDV